MLGLYYSYNGTIYKDISTYATDIECTTNKYGFWYLTCTLNMSERDVADLYKMRKISHVYYGDGVNTWFEGRLEDVEYGSDPKITAYGYVRGFSDLQVTDAWSTRDYTRWKVVQKGNYSSTLRPDWFTHTNEANLTIAYNKNTHPANTGLSVAESLYMLSVPNQSTRKFNAVSGIVTLKNAPGINTNYGLLRINPNTFTLYTPYNFNYYNTSITTNRTDRITISAPDTDGLAVQFVAISSGLYVGETGAYELSASGFRVGTSPSVLSNALYADEILKYTISGVYALNPNFINPTWTYIQSSQRDLEEVWFEDMTGLDVVEFLLQFPDRSNQKYELKVWEDQVVIFRPEKTVYETWYIYIDDFTLKRSLDETYNQWRGVYSKSIEESTSTIYRTSWLSNADSQNQYGITRQQSVKIQTDNATTAQNKVQQIVDDKKLLQLKGSIPVSHIFDTYGAKRDARLVRSGDKVIIQNVPASMLDEIENTFWVVETKWNDSERLMYITPEEPLDTLAKIIGNQ